MRTPPYLPFRTGPPLFAPRLSPISQARWLTPDSEAAALPEKRALMRSQRGAVVAGLAFAREAAEEAAALVQEAVGETAEAWPSAFEAAAALVSDDLCVMTPEDEGWRLGPAVVCAPTFWRLSEMSGRTLAGLHGPVPDGDPRLAARIARVFSGLRPDWVLERFNWTVQAGGARYTPSSAPLKARAAAAGPEEAASLLHLRVERQTVRKLPQTGAVLFTIRIAIDPLTAALTEPADRVAFAKAWREASPQARAYKGWAVYDHLVRAVAPESLDERR